MTEIQHDYDVVVVGAGPQGLAVVARLLENMPDTFNDHESVLKTWYRTEKKPIHKNQLNILVIDPHGGWMGNWKRLFQSLAIQYLRSPFLFHVDPFDTSALLAFAEEQGRQDEILSTRRIFKESTHMNKSHKLRKR
jgi:cation diffusion facilitator CzcD-associated flavoprotein CzcO